VNFRRFEPQDAAFCFKVRSNAFIQKFSGELTPVEVSAGVNSYLAGDYIRMSEEMPFFIAEDNEMRLGFFAIKQMDDRTAGLHLIYVDLNSVGKGIGKSCIQFIEKWLASNWPQVEKLIVDTVIPEYNSEFYKSLGFIPKEHTFCNLSGLKVKALRLCKQIDQRPIRSASQFPIARRTR